MIKTKVADCILMALLMQMRCQDESKSVRKWVTTVIPRQMSIEQAAPWLVSSVSGLYIMARARRLSISEASDATLARFLFRQSDVVLILCGCPALWYFARHR